MDQSQRATELIPGMDEIEKRAQSALDTCLLCPCSEINQCHHNFNKCHKWAPVGVGNGAAWHSGGTNYIGQAERHRRLPQKKRCQCKCRQLGRKLCDQHLSNSWIRKMYNDEEWVARWFGEMNRLIQEIEDANFHSSTVHLHTHPSVPEEDEMDFVVEVDSPACVPCSSPSRVVSRPKVSPLARRIERVYMEPILIERCQETRVEQAMEAIEALALKTELTKPHLDIGISQQLGLAGVWG